MALHGSNRRDSLDSFEATEACLPKTSQMMSVSSCLKHSQAINRWFARNRLRVSGTSEGWIPQGMGGSLPTTRCNGRHRHAATHFGIYISISRFSIGQKSIAASTGMFILSNQDLQHTSTYKSWFLTSGLVFVTVHFPIKKCHQNPWNKSCRRRSGAGWRAISWSSWNARPWAVTGLVQAVGKKKGGWNQMEVLENQMVKKMLNNILVFFLYVSMSWSH